MADYVLERHFTRNNTVIMIIYIPGLDMRFNINLQVASFNRMSVDEIDYMISKAVERRIKSADQLIDSEVSDKIKALKDKV